MTGLFTLRAELPKRTWMMLGTGGLMFMVLFWWLVIVIGGIRPEIFPTPLEVVKSIPELHFEDGLIRNFVFSIMLNVLGLLEAVAISLPLGFLIGLFPFFRGTMMGPINASRFTPITALIGLFMLWFGIYANMKIQFLALGTLVYLIPVVVQRNVEVKQVYVDVVTTLGATQWQQIKTVFIPDVLSRVFDDIRVISAISWTYIIIAETVNMTEGGIGALAFKASKQVRPDKVFAILFIILIFGVIWDQCLIRLGRILFPHKFVRGGA